MKALNYMISILVAIAAGCLILLLQSWLNPACEITTIKTATSPNGQLEASLDLSKCPDQDEPELALKMMNKNNPNEWKSVDIASAISTNIELAWLSDQKLAILYKDTLKLRQTPTEINGVRLDFRTR